MSCLALPAENPLNGKKLEAVKIHEDHETRMETASSSSRSLILSGTSDIF